MSRIGLVVADGLFLQGEKLCLLLWWQLLVTASNFLLSFLEILPQFVIKVIMLWIYVKVCNLRIVLYELHVDEIDNVLLE